ncbi:MAG: hypothetical protein R3F61_12565 [Myxococcota bacterium]
MMLWTVALFACGGGDGPRTIRLEDVGTFCIDPADGAYVVDFDQCLSSSCDTLVSAECTGSLDGDVLTLTTLAVIESSEGECTADCGAVVAECTGWTVSDTENLVVELGDQTFPYRNLGACE